MRIEPGFRLPLRGSPRRTASPTSSRRDAGVHRGNGLDYDARTPRDRALELDAELRRLSGRDRAGRRTLGLLAARFFEIRGHERLGFARLGDYSAERLGWSARQLQEVGRVAGALRGLPRIEETFLRGELGWTKARLLASLCTPSDEEGWIEVAANTDVRTLARLTSNARHALREEHKLFSPPRRAPLSDDDEEEEERVIIRVACTRRSIFLWKEARRLAALLAGRVLAPWEVAELVAAEATSRPGPYGEQWAEEPWKSIAARASRVVDPCCDNEASDTAGREGEVSASREDASATEREDASAAEREDASAAEREHSSAPAREGAPAASDPASPGPGPATPLDAADFRAARCSFEHELEKLSELDAFELDAAMRRVREAMQESDWLLGRTLSLFIDLRLHEKLGYASVADYVCDRLGVSERSARDLVRVAQVAERKSAAVAAAYSRGELSWLQVQRLLRVLRPWNAAAWIERAKEVTLRRLSDEVEWARSRADVSTSFAAMMPPPPDAELRASAAAGDAADAADRQMCAGAAGETRDGQAPAANDGPAPEFFGILGRFHVSFVAPASIGSFFRSVMQGFARPTEPRWLGFERMLEQVLAQWSSEPRHRDPVFARDGFRCTAPGCTSHSNLHDHHIVPRSENGSDELSNRTTLCAFHHLRGVHGGLASARGSAPSGIDWELGLSSKREALLRARNERYVRKETARPPRAGAQ